ncbi:MAG TPA: CHASE2 domain-containing protein, partial [Candidatus Dormibacteraeota bacterium]|nr:CHASE2 domain-containing protein [Candidatus Dormibacteraeota bacterium]
MGKHAGHRKSGTIAAVVTVLLGWALVFPQDPPGLLARWSYDFVQYLLPGHAYQDTIIITLDTQAMGDYATALASTAGRTNHTRLLNRLSSQDQPKVVVVDLALLSKAGDPVVDDQLARAMHRNGRVVLAADKVRIHGLPMSETDVPPLQQFETNAAKWGISKVWKDTDGVVRRYGILRLDPGIDKATDLASAAARVAGASSLPAPQRLSADQRRWLNYYRSAFLMSESSSMSYTNAETQARGFFDG